MRKSVFYLLIVVFNLSCSSDSNNEQSVNLELLTSGQWYDVGDLCNTQNNLKFNEDGTYIRLFSFNSCDQNNYDTYQYTGTYTINGDNISLNQQTQTIIEMGVLGGQPNQEFGVLVNRKIIQLTETQLTIENEYNAEPIFRNWVFTK